MAEATNRITGSQIQEVVRTKLINLTTTRESVSKRIFYFGQVISNSDEKNLNRIKVRIPVIDDIFYVNKTNEEGDKSLPFCVPFSSRFLDVPETNSIVLVAAFDPSIPYLGRMYFDSYSEFSASDIYNRMLPEEVLLSNWGLIEDIHEIIIQGKPITTTESKGEVNYKVGIRGKGNNKLLLDKDFVELTQNVGEETTRIKLSKNIELNAYEFIDILSTKSDSNIYGPVFDQPLFVYISELNSLIKELVKVLTTTPAISPAGPCTPSPQARALTKKLKTLAKQFEQFVDEGSSKKIRIN